MAVSRKVVGGPWVFEGVKVGMGDGGELIISWQT